MTELMRLKYLELHGYKTFASPTSFVFDGGITAIVGPNGSGKSNVADAIRWVLGEQSFRALRGKRTEDMIFSGSALRARLGMASASLTFDNSDGWLPIDFSEVSLTRRAYRSGENEYLINGHRVRLADIVELLAKSGLAQRTYTVIGQGVVDAVLSLRPDDRRALFEEAAGIAVHRAKRSEALSRLDDTRTNLVRVYDIVGEIAPRLQRLEREAERARVRGLLEQQLDGLLRTWYGYRWHGVQIELAQARDLVAHREVRLGRERESLVDVQEQMSVVRARQAHQREQVGAWHRESSALHQQMEDVQRDLAVWQERARLLSLQAGNLESEVADTRVRAQEAALKTAAAGQALAESELTLAERQAQVDAAQADLDSLEARRAQLSGAVADAQAALMEHSIQGADRRSRAAQLGEQRADLSRQAAGFHDTIESLEKDLSLLSAQVNRLAAQRDRLVAEREQRQADVARLQADLSTAREDQANGRNALSRARLLAEQVQDRQEALGRLRREGEGLHAGVRAVLEAAGAQGQGGRDGRKPGRALEGVLGTVAQLVEVPERYEVALEVALGGHLQDIIVESWSCAEAAIALLRAEKRGRATFLPLDTVRPASRIDVPHIDGVVGRGSDLVHAGEKLTPVVEMLLARTLVVQDLKTARRAFDSLQGGFQIVTVGGEVLRSSGSVTGGLGQGAQQSWMLAREREWRELPDRLSEARRHVDAAASDLDRADSTQRSIGERLALQVSQMQAAAGAETAADSDLARLRRQVDRCEQQLSFNRRLLEQAQARSLDLAEQEATALRDLSQLAGEARMEEQKLSALQGELEALRGDALYLALSDARSALAVTRRNTEHRRAILEGAGEREQELLRQLDQGSQRLSALRREVSSLAEAIQGQVSRQKVIEAWLSGLAQKLGPAEDEVAALENEYEQLSAREAAGRVRLREAESSHSEAQLACSRVEDTRQRLRRQIMDDFGLVDMEPMPDQPEQPPLPLNELVSTLPVVTALPPGLEEDMHQLRGQIKRLGPANPGALAEYEEVRARHAFLTGQAADLEEASQRLRDVIVELDEVMRREFRRTFEAVQARFHENFSRLFAGGSARLSLTDPDDLGATGVEISARPPGKRQQTLALLSGGERSLTAVALIFAFLQTNPPPFCILDEVDAMLDEANVQRFRAMLQELAQTTQFIVITHNRTTVQAADTIYGVTMGQDSASQVVSLRLEGDRVATVTGTPVESGTA